MTGLRTLLADRYHPDNCEIKREPGRWMSPWRPLDTRKNSPHYAMAKRIEAVVQRHFKGPLRILTPA